MLVKYTIYDSVTGSMKKSAEEHDHTSELCIIFLVRGKEILDYNADGDLIGESFAHSESGGVRVHVRLSEFTPIHMKQTEENTCH